MQNPANLRVTAAAEALVDDVYRFTEHFPPDERYNLRTQMRRAATSISSNIYEGCGRQGNRALLPFLHNSFASAQELHGQLRQAMRLGLGDHSIAAKLVSTTIHVKRMLSCLIKAIQARLASPPSTKA